MHSIAGTPLKLHACNRALCWLLARRIEPLNPLRRAGRADSDDEFGPRTDNLDEGFCVRRGSSFERILAQGIAPDGVQGGMIIGSRFSGTLIPSDVVRGVKISSL